MEPVLIEASCKLRPEDPKWKDISSVSLEIGYPGRSGQTLWKHIGWLNDQSAPAGRAFAHALWNQELTHHVLLFDFLPVFEPKNNELEQTYRIRKNITRNDGRLLSTKSRILRGDRKSVV